MDPDSAIRSTDTDAAQARLSAVNKGYLTDEFITFFVPRARFLQPRPPLINVGTFVRATAIDELVHQWIDANDESQIVSLGAGSDTRLWRLSAARRLSKVKHYVEVDFAENTARKAAIIRKTPFLSQHLSGNIRTENGGIALRSEKYTLYPCDLRQPPSTTLGQLVQDGTLSPEVPTLFISECVFVYMPREASDALIAWFTETFKTVGGVLYEMFGLNDSFGNMMRHNLMSRGVALPGVDAYASLESQRARFLDQSLTRANSLSLKTIRRSYIPRAEMSRIAELEMLDEVEELELVLEHYVIAWGVKEADMADQSGQHRLSEWELRIERAPELEDMNEE